MKLSTKKQTVIVMSFIEAHIELYQELNINTICDAFGYNRGTATNYLNRYKELKPSNLRYLLEGTKSRYVRGISFERLVLEGSALEFLNMVDALYSDAALQRFEERYSLT
ncbi:hypothetical protein [Vibrio agarivorans]|uniref:DNA-binding transcriptional repressor CapW winged helix-turn-helix domain-containing protein n=1 Tax=Vibrio agarivorans TaxID=153622 RepID=A0ABT7Y7B8_9VIBR|nr:hypothetical protein [Vibrio agarivorans]MDN2483845.1 hypothetical protein [Vibrio agarivorans]